MMKRKYVGSDDVYFDGPYDATGITVVRRDAHVLQRRLYVVKDIHCGGRRHGHFQRTRHLW